MSQEIAPNGTDQFEFALQLRNPDAPGTHMYQLKVSLTRDGSHNIDAGVAVVGAPEVFDSNPTTEDLAASGEVGECFRRLAIIGGCRTGRECGRQSISRLSRSTTGVNPR